MGIPTKETIRDMIIETSKEDAKNLYERIVELSEYIEELRGALEYAEPILKKLSDDDEIGDRAAYAGQAYLVVRRALS